MQALTDIKELPEIGVAQAKKTQVYGGIAGLIVGAAIGGLYNANVSLSFIPKVGSKLSALLGFLLGAGIYGYGMSGKVDGKFRSLTQVSGIAFAGMSLGKLLAEFNLPTFGLASEDSDFIGYTGDGRVIGLQAEDTEEEFGQNYSGRTTGNTVMRADEDEAHDYVPDYSATSYNPTMKDTTMGGVPSWTQSGLSNPSLPEYDSAVSQGMVMPMRGSVTQWYGSAEGVTHKVQGTSVGNNFSMTEGTGSVVGQ
jgi:hypothetical protein|tara:strand:+ start:553 stop:1308 length:756 start_codon:yes stop_codon:yes gene_type:complete